MILKLVILLALISSDCFATPLNKTILDELKSNKREMKGDDKCAKVMGEKISLHDFSNEIAFSFFNNGDVEELDLLLKYLVRLKCVSLI